MNAVWGIVMILIGIFFFISGILKSNFVIYRLLISRSRLLWGEGNAVHYFYIVVGILIAIVGILLAFGVIGK
jgi:hypothetical protein